MKKIKSSLIIKILVPLAYVAMVTVNFLANSLPINNITPGQVSDSYPNLFAPAGFTFSIWGLIYLFLGAYAIYQLGIFKKIKINDKLQTVYDKIGLYFIISSLANLLWIFAWHYDFIGLSLLLIIGMLICLIKIADTLRVQKLKTLDFWLLKTPFSLYFGWITVAAIANVTVFLVSINWRGFGLADITWLAIILVVATIIGLGRMLYDKDVIYGLVLIWAYFGILSKHLSVSGFNSMYPLAIVILIISMILFLSANILLIAKPSYLDRIKFCKRR